MMEIDFLVVFGFGVLELRDDTKENYEWCHHSKTIFSLGKWWLKCHPRRDGLMNLYIRGKKQITHAYLWEYVHPHSTSLSDEAALYYLHIYASHSCPPALFSQNKDEPHFFCTWELLKCLNSIFKNNFRSNLI